MCWNRRSEPAVCGPGPSGTLDNDLRVRVQFKRCGLNRVWNYVGELIFNMLVLVGSIKMGHRIIRELMGLG